MPTLTLTSITPEKINELRAAFTARQSDDLTQRNALTPGVLKQVADAPLTELAKAGIPLLSLAALMETWRRGLSITL